MTKQVLFSLLTLGVIISMAGGIVSGSLKEGDPKYERVITQIAQKYELDFEEVEAVITAVRDEKSV